MKKILIVRHGYYSVSDLTSTGREQMKDLGMAIKSLMNGDSIEVKSSTAHELNKAPKFSPRYWASASRNTILWSGPDSPRGAESIWIRLSRLSKALEPTSSFWSLTLNIASIWPTHLGKKICGKDHGFPSEETGKGEAWFIDCQAGTCTWLSPDVAR